MEGRASDSQGEDDVRSRLKASKFRFKSKSDRRSKRHHDCHDDDDENDNHEGHRSKRQRSKEDKYRRKHRHSKSRQRSHRSDRDRKFDRSGEYDNPDHRYRESMFDHLGGEGIASSHVDPEAAFRESLFDAMADDEGAQYWEGVYGQPVHIYPNTKTGPDGKLERMSEDEYAEYVRTKMWEKSHQHILEERAAKEKARRKQKKRQDELEEDVAREEAERDTIRRQMEESLKRGEGRKRAREAEASWKKYLSGWDYLKNNPEVQNGSQKPRDIIPWPVASGKADQVEHEEIERFLKSSSAWRSDATAVLKTERVRWHPDKMQQRFGQHVDPDTMKQVTAVFQVIDRLWTERTRHLR